MKEGRRERVAMARRAVGASGSIVNNKLASRTADAGRGEIRKVVGGGGGGGGDSHHILMKA